MKKFESKPAGILCNVDLKTIKGRILYYCMFIILIILCLIAIIPSLWIFFNSFKQPQEIYTSFSFFPKDKSIMHMLTSIKKSWVILKLGIPMINTVVMSFGCLVANIVVSGLGGYVLSKLKPKGSRVIFLLVVWTMMMPFQMRLVPVYISWLHFPFVMGNSGINLLDTYWPMWLSAAARAFDVILFKNNFDALSQSYVDAGKLDGCGDLGVLFRIMFPMSMPIIIYISITTLTQAWSNFLVPLLVLNKNVTLPVQLYRMQSDKTIQMNTYFMGLIFSSIPPFVLFLLFQKHIMGGITVGGVKG